MPSFHPHFGNVSCSSPEHKHDSGCTPNVLHRPHTQHTSHNHNIDDLPRSDDTSSGRTSQINATIILTANLQKKNSNTAKKGSHALVHPPELVVLPIHGLISDQCGAENDQMTQPVTCPHTIKHMVCHIPSTMPPILRVHPCNAVEGQHNGKIKTTQGKTTTTKSEKNTEINTNQKEVPPLVGCQPFQTPRCSPTNDLFSNFCHDPSPTPTLQRGHLC